MVFCDYTATIPKIRLIMFSMENPEFIVYVCYTLCTLSLRCVCVNMVWTRRKWGKIYKKDPQKSRLINNSFVFCINRILFYCSLNSTQIHSLFAGIENTINICGNDILNWFKLTRSILLIDWGKEYVFYFLFCFISLAHGEMFHVRLEKENLEHFRWWSLGEKKSLEVVKRAKNAEESASLIWARRIDFRRESVFGGIL